MDDYISAELLSAFLDGNTSAEETLKVLRAAEQNEEIQSEIRVLQELDDDVVFIGQKNEKLPMTALAAKKKDNYLCDIECEEFILYQFGIETTHKSLLDEAYRNCCLRDKGMPLYNIGRLLEKNNLSVSRRYDSTIEDIDRLIAIGNQLIAVVDNSLLNEEETTEQLPNHAVDINSISLSDGKIVLYNPNREENLTVYSLTSFCRAWKNQIITWLLLTLQISLYMNLTL